MANKLIIGLGNPGKEFENTYHNAGRLALEAMAGAAEWKKHKNLFEYAEGDHAVFVRPLTFMNESGQAVREAMKKFKVQPEGLTVIHDDSDIVIGSFKLSFARNSAGHKGVQSIIDTLHGNKFFRARIGIRPVREARRQKAGEFALKKISPKDKKTLETIFAALKSVPEGNGK